MTSCRLVESYRCFGGTCCLDSYHEDGGNTFHRNICDCFLVDMASCSRRLESLSTPLWEFQFAYYEHWYLWDGDYGKSVYSLYVKCQQLLARWSFQSSPVLCSQRCNFITTDVLYFPIVLHYSGHFCAAGCCEDCHLLPRLKTLLLCLCSPYVITTEAKDA